MKPEIKHRIEQIKNGQVPEGYKKTKIGIVPKDWEDVSFGDLFETKVKYTEDLNKYPIYSLTIEDGVTAKSERYERSHLVKKENAYKVVEPNDFAYNPMNVRFGAVARRKGDFPVCVSGYYDIFTAKEKTDLKFMDSFLISGMMIKYYNKVSTGSLVEKQRVHYSDFIEFNLPMASAKEREKIAKILSTQDKVIELREKVVEELKKQKKYYLSKMFPQKGKNVPEIRFKGFTDPWEQRKLGDVLETIKDGTHGTHQDADNGPLLLSAKNVKNGTIIWDETDRKISKDEYEKIHAKFRLQNNDVLLTIVGSIGETAILRDVSNITFQRSVAFLRPSKNITSEFLCSEIQTPRFQKELDNRKSTSAQPGIYLGDLSEVPFVYSVNKDEQNKIGEYFAQLDNLIALHQRELEQEKQKKKALMQLLLKGIVRVN